MPEMVTVPEAVGRIRTILRGKPATVLVAIDGAGGAGPSADQLWLPLTAAIENEPLRLSWRRSCRRNALRGIGREVFGDDVAAGEP